MWLLSQVYICHICLKKKKRPPVYSFICNCKVLFLLRAQRRMQFLPKSCRAKKKKKKKPAVLFHVHFVQVGGGGVALTQRGSA